MPVGGSAVSDVLPGRAKSTANGRKVQYAGQCFPGVAAMTTAGFAVLAAKGVCRGAFDGYETDGFRLEASAPADCGASPVFQVRHS